MAIAHHHSGDLVDHDSVDAFDAMLRESDPLYDIDVAGAMRLSECLAQLREAREARGITQREVADLMGTKQSAVSDLERGASNPTLTTLRRYGAALGKYMNVEFSDSMPLWGPTLPGGTGPWPKFYAPASSPAGKCD